MKAFLLAGLLLMVCVYVSVKPKPLPVLPSTDTAKRFEVQIEELLPDGSARASASFWDLSPNENERDYDNPRSKFFNFGEIVIRNPPADAKVGQQRELWLEPHGGIKSKPSNKPSMMTRAFDVVDAPVTPVPNRKRWMRETNSYWK